MSGRKNGFVMSGFVLAVSLIASAVTALFVSCHYSRLMFDLLNEICGEVIEQEPEMDRIISAALKEYTGDGRNKTEKQDVLSALGYQSSDFSGLAYRQSVWSATAGLAAGILLLPLFFYTGITGKSCGSGRWRNIWSR